MIAGTYAGSWSSIKSCVISAIILARKKWLYPCLYCPSQYSDKECPWRWDEYDFDDDPVYGHCIAMK